MIRRKFIALLGARRRHGRSRRGRSRRAGCGEFGVLMLYLETDAERQVRAAAFQQELEKLGWVAGRNVQIDFRWRLCDTVWIRSAVTQM